MTYSGDRREGSRISVKSLARGTALALFLVAAPVLVAAPAIAQQGASGSAAQSANTRPFNIPAQPLTSAVTAFGDQAGLQVTVDGAILAGLSSQPVTGRFSPAEALSRLLAGTGITWRWVDRRSVALERAPQSADGTIQLGPVRVEGGATQLATASTGLNDYKTTATELTGSYTAQAATLFKGAQSLREIPQSVTVVTRQVMDDLNLLSLDDVARNTTGIVLERRPGGGSDYYSRGFIVANRMYDGAPLSRANYTTGNQYYGNTAWLDRVEFFRGAQGLLEGAGNPAGSINLVRRRGLDTARFAMNARLGSWSRFGGMFDAGGPLTADAALRGRFVVDYDDGDAYYDLGYERRFNAYAALDADLSPDTTIGIGVSHSRVTGRVRVYGNPRYSNGPSVPLPRSAFLGSRYNHQEREETQLFGDLTHRFSGDWKIRVAGTYVDEKVDYHFMRVDGPIDPVTRTGAKIGFTAASYRPEHYGADASLTGTFSALGLRHTLLIGGTISRMKSDDDIWTGVGGAVDVFDKSTYENVAPAGELAFNGNTKWDPVLQRGVYGTLRTNLTDAFTVIVGGRLDWYKYVYAFTNWGGGATRTSSTGRFTPYAGLVYAIAPQWSLYASYATIFKPQSARTAAGNILDPVEGRNYEAPRGVFRMEPGSRRQLPKRGGRRRHPKSGA